MGLRSIVCISTLSTRIAYHKVIANLAILTLLNTIFWLILQSLQLYTGIYQQSIMKIGAQVLLTIYIIKIHVHISCWSLYCSITYMIIYIRSKHPYSFDYKGVDKIEFYILQVRITYYRLST